MHIGDKIKEVMKQNNVSVEQLSDTIGSELSNTYRILKKENMDITLLKRISKALNHNFFDDISQDISLQTNKQTNTQ
ncbi:MAG: helix-turn-helix transcriptional regulator [Bacteroidales bacterium]|nr:helix-turn-helix transcriptional regulator [Bacteroidales bacterium]